MPRHGTDTMMGTGCVGLQEREKATRQREVFSVNTVFKVSCWHQPAPVSAFVDRVSAPRMHTIFCRRPACPIVSPLAVRAPVYSFRHGGGIAGSESAVELEKRHRHPAPNPWTHQESTNIYREGPEKRSMSGAKRCLASSIRQRHLYGVRRPTAASR